MDQILYFKSIIFSCKFNLLVSTFERQSLFYRLLRLESTVPYLPGNGRHSVCYIRPSVLPAYLLIYLPTFLRVYLTVQTTTTCTIVLSRDKTSPSVKGNKPQCQTNHLYLSLESSPYATLITIMCKKYNLILKNCYFPLQT